MLNNRQILRNRNCSTLAIPWCFYKISRAFDGFSTSIICQKDHPSQLKHRPIFRLLSHTKIFFLTCDGNCHILRREKEKRRRSLLACCQLPSSLRTAPPIQLDITSCIAFSVTDSCGGFSAYVKSVLKLGLCATGHGLLGDEGTSVRLSPAGFDGLWGTPVTVLM